MDNETTIKCGLVGYPIGHSLSPKMHNAAFKEFDLSYRYHLYPVELKNLGSFISSLREDNIKGLNVTVPYKEKILPYLDQKSDAVEKIGAANTLVVEDGKLKGFNTDFLGFSKHLQELVDPYQFKVALLGAGGAAKAVVYSLLKDKVKTISIFDIDKKKAKELVKRAKGWSDYLGADTKINQAESVKALDIFKKNLLINATPVGLKESDPLIVPEELFCKDLVVYDLIYNPAMTKILAAAKDKGLKFSNGLGMLVYQGAESFLHFTGINLELDNVAAIMKEALTKEGRR
ncbi:MAG: shikimate dehydrogenase [Candidatus Omnitrophica bacterium]|nr:shikimate dehydrogenase [Candidatus Omnitrophota bacterium]MCF7894076.1 shikimate dehydrogenase [Candidatus Omnitrophota bacterium]